MDKELQEKLRNLKVDVLQFLHLLATTDSVALELKEISSSTSTPESNLRGIISTIRRMKIKGKILIQPAGRDSAGRYRWKIDESAVNKSELAKFLETEILGKENIKWQK